MRKIFVLIITTFAICSCYKELGPDNRGFFILNDNQLESIDGKKFDYTAKEGGLTLKIVAPSSFFIVLQEEYDWIAISSIESYSPEDCEEYALGEEQVLYYTNFHIKQNNSIMSRKAKLRLGNRQGVTSRAEITIRQSGK